MSAHEAKVGARRRWAPSTGPFSTARGMLPLLVVSVFLFALPILMLIVGAFRNAPPGQAPAWSLEAFARTYGNPDTFLALGNSALLAVSSTLIGVSAAIVLAFLVTRTTTPLRRLVTPAMVLVLALPPLFYALSWGMLGNPVIGLINVAWTNITGAAEPLFNAESWAGLILVTALKNAAFAYLLLIGPFSALDRALEEAARVSGAGRLRTLLGIDLVVLSPAMLGVGILSFVIGLEAFEVPLLLGTRAGIDVFSTEIYSHIADRTPADYGAASALSMLLILIVIVLVLLQWSLLGKRQYTTVTGKSFRTERWDIGAWSWAGTAFIVAYLSLAIVLPLLQLVLGSLQPVFGGSGALTVVAYERLFADPATPRALLTTFATAIAGGLGAMLIALTIVYALTHNETRLRRWIELLTWLPYAVPGVVLSLGLLWTYVSIPGLNRLYGSIVLVALGLVVAVTPVATRAIQPAIMQLNRELEEASRVSGAKPWATVRRIVVPLILPSFLAGWFVVGIVVSGNLAIPILLASSRQTPTVPMRVFELYSEGRTPQAAALFVVFLSVILLGFLLASGAVRLLSAAARSRRAASEGEPLTRDASSRAGDSDGTLATATTARRRGEPS
ncbi:iron ABC transporter permease [Leucobacter sp. wl10]|uniref:ABC transporter permease n=1 Tax=Leucobacter sp. wl10 TaxID=2304677 RepID=UPI000E5A98E4|nr:iron ABC transporter permease [Leucobacter sp. wl10]RGE18954.1 iron ABC transporter permease [Leucobacter sp. wl10]